MLLPGEIGLLGSRREVLKLALSHEPTFERVNLTPWAPPGAIVWPARNVFHLHAY